jgi:hypothetical protein
MNVLILNERNYLQFLLIALAKQGNENAQKKLQEIMLAKTDPSLRRFIIDIKPTTKTEIARRIQQ